MLGEGLSYKKLDLHIHTPASHDFKGEVTPADIIDESLKKGLNGIAITDHNSGDWIDCVKDAAVGTDLIIIPGVEISCVGGKRNIHIIALFDVDKDSEYINSFLAALDVKPDDRGLEETIINKTVLEVIDIVQDKWDGLAILAHANSSSGVLSDMQGIYRNEILNYKNLTAVEATDFENEDKKRKNKRVVDLLDGKDQNYHNKIAVYQASDNPCTEGGHSKEGIGTRCTFFKLELINLNGLRQCFCDPDVRITQDFDFKQTIYPRISTVKISGGFLGNQEVVFHPGLNSILGGKGTGKSLLIELLRFVLNQPPIQEDILRDHNSKLSHQLGEYESVEICLIDESGKDIIFTRTFQSAQNHPFDIDYDPAQLFPILFLSQNEIIRIAEEESYQLGFIDQFFDFRAYKQQINTIEIELKNLDQQMAESLRSFPIVEELLQNLSTLEEEIKRIDQALNHPVFEKYKELEKKGRAFLLKETLSQIFRTYQKMFYLNSRI